MVKNIGEADMATQKEMHLVTRTVKIENIVSIDCEDIIADALTILEGVTNVAVNRAKGNVTVTYDLQKTQIQEVEKLLIEISYPASMDFLARKTREWLHYTEKNELDNLKHVGHCCSKPPKGT
jgi:copper chaperone CopZ